MEFGWWSCPAASTQQEGGPAKSLDGVFLAVKLRLAPLVCKLFFKGLLENKLYTLQAYLQQTSCTDHSNVHGTWSGAVNLTNISLVIFYFLGHEAHYPSGLSEIPPVMSSKQALKPMKASGTWFGQVGTVGVFRTKGVFQ